MSALLRNALLAASLALTPATGVFAGELKSVPPSPAHELALKDVDGREHALGQYKGKVVVVNFWATWCPPCVEEMPSLQRLQDRLGRDGLVVLAVSIGDSEEKIRDFLARVPVRFTILRDRDMGVARMWKARGIPTTYVLDTEQIVRYSAVGELDWSAQGVIDTLTPLLPKASAQTPRAAKSSDTVQR